MPLVNDSPIDLAISSTDWRIREHLRRQDSRCPAPLGWMPFDEFPPTPDTLLGVYSSRLPPRLGGGGWITLRRGRDRLGRAPYFNDQPIVLPVSRTYRWVGKDLRRKNRNWRVALGGMPLDGPPPRLHQGLRFES